MHHKTHETRSNGRIANPEVPRSPPLLKYAEFTELYVGVSIELGTLVGRIKRSH